MEHGESEFDSRQKFIEELSIIRRNIHIVRMTTDFLGYFEWLKSYFSHLSSVMHTKDLDETWNKFSIIEEIHYDNILKIKNGTKVTIKTFDKYFLFEIWLNRVSADLGLVIPRKRKPSEALSRGTF